jgi:DNA repair protein RadC
MQPLYTRHGNRYRAAANAEILDAAAAIIVAQTRGAMLSSPQEAERLCRSMCAGYHNERFGVVWLDSRHRVIHAETLFAGTIDGATVYPRVVVKRALEVNAAAVILTHNHPSGVAEPSEADRAITLKLSKALALRRDQAARSPRRHRRRLRQPRRAGLVMRPAPGTADFNVQHHNTIALLRPDTENASAWCDEYLVTEGALTWGRAYVVEPRYREDILRAIVLAGWTVQLRA